MLVSGLTTGASGGKMGRSCYDHMRVSENKESA